MISVNRFDCKMRISVSCAFVRTVKYFPFIQRPVAGKPDTAGADTAKRKRNILCFRLLINHSKPPPKSLLYCNYTPTVFPCQFTRYKIFSIFFTSLTVISEFRCVCAQTLPAVSVSRKNRPPLSDSRRSILFVIIQIHHSGVSSPSVTTRPVS